MALVVSSAPDCAVPGLIVDGTIKPEALRAVLKVGQEMSKNDLDYVVRLLTFVEGRKLLVGVSGRSRYTCKCPTAGCAFKLISSSKGSNFLVTTYKGHTCEAVEGTNSKGKERLPAKVLVRLCRDAAIQIVDTLRPKHIKRFLSELGIPINNHMASAVCKELLNNGGLPREVDETAIAIAADMAVSAAAEAEAEVATEAATNPKTNEVNSVPTDPAATSAVATAPTLTTPNASRAKRKHSSQLVAMEVGSPKQAVQSKTAAAAATATTATEDDVAGSGIDTTGLSDELCRLMPEFQVKPPQDQEDVPEEEQEPGQTLVEFRGAIPKLMRPCRPFGSKRTKIYLQPIGEFAPGASPSLERLRELCAAYYMGMEVVLNKSWSFVPQAQAQVSAATNTQTMETQYGQYNIPHRQAPDGQHMQLQLGDIVDALMYKMPRDCWCIIGVTMRDLYEDEDTFCIGRAWGASRAGVFGFHRYLPENVPATVAQLDVQEQGLSAADLMLYRSGKTVVHEIGHCFLVDHCIQFRCIMNATTCLEEDFKAPYLLCPTDLAKFQYSIQFNVVERYKKLLALFTVWPGFAAEAQTIQHLLSLLISTPQPGLEALPPPTKTSNTSN
eukprot:m.365339 g.365339  ORF g.365339 m.365339 type:complete len:612 (-) comp31001_c0_seq1:433-2268(-)